ncbi:MAG: hypothetical protein ACLQVD_05525 [Capsulimonadaceae bacterium]
MAENTPLDKQFEVDMYAGVELLKSECGYNASYFLQMLHEHGGVGTAKRLLASSEFQAGLIRLYEEKKLIYSMENAVLQKKYLPLFTYEERKTAKKRLKDLDFEPAEWD